MALDGVYHEQATRSPEDHYLVSFNCVTHFLNIFFTCLLTSFCASLAFKNVVYLSSNNNKNHISPLHYCYEHYYRHHHQLPLPFQSSACKRDLCLHSTSSQRHACIYCELLQQLNMECSSVSFAVSAVRIFCFYFLSRFFV